MARLAGNETLAPESRAAGKETPLGGAFSGEMEQSNRTPVPEATVAACAATALALGYSAPMPGLGSRYRDGGVAHEARMLSVVAAQETLADSGRRGVGETVLETTLASLAFAGIADPRAAGYLAPFARAALLGQTSSRVLASLGYDDLSPFARALEAAGEDGQLAGALGLALGAGKNTTLRDAMRFASARDPMAREYARGFEVTRELARPALLAALSRGDSARGALVQTYIEVLSEVPDLAVTERAGSREAEEVSRMAHGVLKAGGVHSRRGLEGIANFDGLLRADQRLAPSATEPPAIAAAFLVALEYGPAALSSRLRPATGYNRGR